MKTFVCHFTSVTIPVIASYIEENKLKKKSKILTLAEFSKRNNHIIIYIYIYLKKKV